MADAGLRWFNSREEFEAAVRPGLQLRRERERTLARSVTYAGHCLACGRDVAFNVPSGNWFDTEPDLREGWHCPNCGCNNRQRLLLHAAQTLLSDPRTATASPRVYLAEAFSALAVLVRDAGWQLTLSDYVSPRARSGSVHYVGGHQVTHQDLTATNLPTSEFDLVLHAEVLEHVPDWRGVLVETARLVRPGGWMVFTAPFLQERDEFLVRAVVKRRVLRRSQVRHLLPPEVHGAPLHPDGVLVYQVPGWSILSALRDAGYGEVRIGWLSDPDFGVTSNNSDHGNYMEPVVFAARLEAATPAAQLGTVTAAR